MSYDKALQLAQQQQANFLISILNTRLAELGLITAKDQNRWSLDLTFGTKQIRENTHHTNGSTQWDNTVGVMLEIPIGDRSLKREELRALADIKIQNIAREEAHRNLAQQVRSILNELDTRWREFEIAAHTVKLARQTLNAEHEKLKFGRSNNFQIINFENQLREMENMHQSSRIAYQNALTRFELILGMTLESWEITLNDI
ncbi:TolC family protein [Acinetobacter sp. ABJ_C3_5]|uniref:TolC family protein n=1 Tax=Acinetobacter courvalinii TaxID=280147 RepID=UPI0037CB8B38